MLTVVGGRLTAKLVFATLEPALPPGAVHLLWPDPEFPGEEVRGVVATRRDLSNEETAALVEQTLRGQSQLVFERVDDGFVIRPTEGGE